MSVITLTEPLFYKAGVSGVSRVVGNDLQDNAIVSRVVRYAFTVPQSGARKVSLTLYSGTHDGSWIPLRFFVGTDPDSHANANMDYEYTGDLVLQEDYLTFIGQADIVLVPGKTYYLWVFPASKDYGYYGWHSTKDYTIEVSGNVCAVNLFLNNAWKQYMPILFHEGEWWLCTALLHDGSNWFLCG